MFSYIKLAFSPRFPHAYFVNRWFKSSYSLLQIDVAIQSWTESRKLVLIYFIDSFCEFLNYLWLIISIDYKYNLKHFGFIDLLKIC